MPRRSIAGGSLPSRVEIRQTVARSEWNARNQFVQFLDDEREMFLGCIAIYSECKWTRAKATFAEQARHQVEPRRRRRVVACYFGGFSKR